MSRNFHTWLAELLGDARRCDMRKRVEIIKPHSLKYFYELGLEPRVDAILNEYQGRRTTDARSTAVRSDST